MKRIELFESYTCHAKKCIHYKSGEKTWAWNCRYGRPFTEIEHVTTGASCKMICISYCEELKE